jgi:hypothetical protein
LVGTFPGTEEGNNGHLLVHGTPGVPSSLLAIGPRLALASKKWRAGMFRVSARLLLTAPEMRAVRRSAAGCRTANEGKPVLPVVEGLRREEEAKLASLGAEEREEGIEDFC